MKEKQVQTREQWLEAAVEQMRPLFEKHEYKIPAIRVSVGWPSSRGLSAKNRTIGQCWSPDASTDKKAQIFISPWLQKECDPYGVLPTLIHEVVHAVVGLAAKHGKKFKQCAVAVGLEGKMTATTASGPLLDTCAAWVKKLGPYPHAKLDSMKSPVKKQTTRMIKCECGSCGYIARTSKKGIEAHGSPICPCNHRSMHYELPEGDGDDDGDDD